jgi:hypothetical protein
VKHYPGQGPRLSALQLCGDSEVSRDCAREDLPRQGQRPQVPPLPLRGRPEGNRDEAHQGGAQEMSALRVCGLAAGKPGEACEDAHDARA